MSAPVPFTLEDAGSYRHWTRQTLRFSDQDPMGHVNNATYVVLFEASRVLFLSRYLDLAGTSNLDTVLARITVDFRHETRFPGELAVGARLVSVGNRSVRTGYGLFRDGRCLATADCVNVFFDTVERRSTDPPAVVREALAGALCESP